MRFKYLIILLGFSFTLFAQSVQVESIEKIEINNDEEFYYPKFYDDNKLLLTKSNYEGLFSFNLSENNLTKISNDQGVGYNPIFNKELNKYYLRTTEIKNGLKYHSIKEIESSSGIVNVLVSNKRSLKIPSQNYSSELVTIQDRKVELNRVSSNQLLKNSQNDLAVYSEDGELILVQNGIQKEISPLGNGVYIWEKLTKQNQILFTFKNDTYMSDLKGNILLHIPDARYPRITSDGKFISFMRDTDDGYTYTSSDIYIYSVDDGTIQNITNTIDKIEMYPEWSESNDKIICNTPEGEIYLLKLKLED